MRVVSSRPVVAGRFLTDVLVLAVLLHIMLLSGWLEGAVQGLTQKRAGDALLMHAVMRSGVTEEQAGGLASRLGNHGNGLKARVIGQAEARGLLALQEPWMQSLPQVEIGRLPLLVEVRLPFTKSVAEARALIEQVRSEPETDFVMFNDSGLEELLAFSRNIDWYSRALRHWLSLLVCVGVMLYAARVSPATRARLPHLLRTMAVFVVALTIAWLAVKMFGSHAGSDGRYRLASGSLVVQWRELLLAATLWILASTVLPIVRTRSSNG